MATRNSRFNRGVPKPGSRALNSTALAALFALLCGPAFTLAPAMAQTVPAQCDEKPGGGKKEDALKACEADLNDAQDEMIDELALLLDEVEAMLPDLDVATLTFTDAQTGEESNLKKHIANMRNENDRAWAAIAETEYLEFEEVVTQAGKESVKNCKWEETEEYADARTLPLDELLGFLPPGLEFRNGVHSKFSDGACNVFKAYVVGDDSGREVNVQERSNNLCERVCKDKEVPDVEPTGGAVVAGNGTKSKKSEKIKQRHIARKNESIDMTHNATAAIQNARNDLVAMNVLADAYGWNFALAPAYEKCAPSGELPQAIMASVKAGLVPVLVALKLVTRGIEAAKDGAHSACRQTVGGFNTSIICLPGIIAYMVSQGSVDVIEGVIVELDSAIEIVDRFSGDATIACINTVAANQAAMLTNMSTSINQLNRRVNALTTGVGDLGTDLQYLQGLILQNREYIKNTREIVLTPHGRRDAVPLYEAPAPSIAGSQ